MVIGIDFDNTIICYDGVLAACARAVGVALPPGILGKRAVRDYLRGLPDGEALWMRVQAEMYGKGIMEALPAPGALAFIEACHEREIPVYVVSHKTEFAAAAADGPNLREAAMAWLRANGFFEEETGLDSQHVYFESTRAEKIARIAALDCTHFIDDLVETFLEPEFPHAAVRMLYHPADDAPAGPWECFRSWEAIGRYFEALPRG